MEFVATCPKGLEQLLAAELASLGLERVRALTGQVSFEGGLADGYRACLWSRIASRVVAVLARLDAADSDALYEGASSIPWEDHVPRGATVAVDAHGANDSLRNTQYVALRTKDAVADRMLARAGVRVATNPASPDLRIACRLHEDRAAIGIDLSGDALFRRGWESARGGRSHALPQLRPDFAAALLAHGQWYRNCRHEAPSLVVGLAGGGSLVAEGLSQALDRAPGLLRASWGFEGWLGHDARAWERLASEASERAEAGAGREVALVACDTRRGWESAVRRTLRSAGISFEPALVAADDARGLRDAVAALPSAPLAAVDATLPAPDDLPAQAATLACASAVAEALGEGASLVAIAPDAAVDAAVRATCAEPLEALYARSEVTMRSYDLATREGEPARVDLGEGRSIPVLVPSSDQFAARLAKMRRHLGKWARREGVGCYRVYDADLPDYAVSVDLYEGAPRPSRAAGGAMVPSGRWCVVSEYAAPAEVDPSLARKRLLDVLAIVPEVLGVAPADTRVRVRTHSKGGSQYAAESGGGRERRDDRRPRPKVVEEGGLLFEVNFDDYLDCGIFLDHRETRSMLRELAKRVPEGGRFCNLFAYTGTATCYVADGGVADTTTVDLSRTYLDWARRNMRRNGFADETHRFVQADALAWVNDQRHGRERYDLVFCDPPTFSNSSRMRKRSFEVQRDHVELLIGISRILAPGGVCVFSCNLRDFAPDVERLARAGVSVEDVTEQTIPEDFSRNPKVHHCYLVRRVPRPKGADEGARGAHGRRDGRGRPGGRDGAPRQGRGHGDGRGPRGPRGGRGDAGRGRGAGFGQRGQRGGGKGPGQRGGRAGGQRPGGRD